MLFGDQGFRTRYLLVKYQVKFTTQLVDDFVGLLGVATVVDDETTQ